MEHVTPMSEYIEYLNLVAVVWLLLFAAVGVFRGFWKSLAAVLALLGAYWLTLVLTEPVTRFAQNNMQWELSGSLVWLIAAFVLFTISGLMLRILFGFLLKALPSQKGILSRIGGGLVGAIYGGVLGLFVLWSLVVIDETRVLARGGNVLEEPAHPLLTLARKLVGRLMEWNASFGGASPELAKMAGVMAEQPTQVLQDVRGLMQSSEFAQLVQNDRIQAIVRERDVEALKRTGEFKELTESVQMQKIRQTLRNRGVEWSEDEMAVQTVQIWNNVEGIRSHPELQELLRDEEVQAFLRGDINVSPTVLQKIQRLLGEVNETTSRASP